MCECLRDPDPGTCVLACPGTAGQHCDCIHAPTGPHRMSRLGEDRVLREAQVRDVLARALIPHLDDPRSAAADAYAALTDLDLGTPAQRAQAHRALHARLLPHWLNSGSLQAQVEAALESHAQAHLAAHDVLLAVRDLDRLNVAATQPGPT
ncbi:hypothetical protein [Nocardioides sp. Leaf285]|uniref:hypothetical protein n=1 Tax=Nocardioides sp. Leaf285 TaxID=1736322 RepID=UPI000702C6E6|nr:hypothetical protein [Nocardioides sp. Leaf285]KQP62893.1 hypothetical protein ASF47_17935 [Nocardioides sp. Leaf285]